MNKAPPISLIVLSGVLLRSIIEWFWKSVTIYMYKKVDDDGDCDDI